VPDIPRTIGLTGATLIGVSAIVGGSILALAGVAFVETGPSAVLAFSLNGVIALITALSFAELAASFPESGGTYAFARKILRLEAAFLVGWVVWFASIVAGVLYALGFAAFAVFAIVELIRELGHTPAAWLTSGWILTITAIIPVGFYTLTLVRKSGGSRAATIGHLLIFVILIIVGIWVFIKDTPADVTSTLTPFFAHGAVGLIAAMGYSFIALQGFDLIAAVGGEIKDPERVIPKSMILSLAIALAIYIPLLLIVTTVGLNPGENISAISAENPETVIAITVQNYLGKPGFWMVMAAAIMSTLSALCANLFAASRVALAMARDRTLSRQLSGISTTRGTPSPAIIASAVMIVVLLLMLPDVASAGAASSLIFLMSFALAHWICILAHRRGGIDPKKFKVPFFPVLPVIGIIACLSLAGFQAITVPAAGKVALAWLALGGGMYWVLFARQARVYEASAEALNPQLMRLRGRNPLVLVPIANPANAESMVTVADAMAPPNFGRVLLLNVVSPADPNEPNIQPTELADAQKVLAKSLTASFSHGLAPEALITVATNPWKEIQRVARVHRCESLLMGFSNITEHVMNKKVEEVIGRVACDVVVLRAPIGWKLADARRVLVPVGGHSGHRVLRARLLGSLQRTGLRSVTFLQVVRADVSDQARAEIEKELRKFAADEATENLTTIVEPGSNVISTIKTQSQSADLIILGLQRQGSKHRTFGDFALAVARETTCAIIMISQKD
jgi:APA family basic amino acid/polyamine antiporter